MPYGVKFVPLSPRIRDHAPRTDFPDLNKFVPVEVMMQVKKDVDDFLASPLFEKGAIGFPSESAIFHEILSTFEPEPSGYVFHNELEHEDDFDFLMQNDDNVSEASTSSDSYSDPGTDFNGSANEDLSFGLLPDACQDVEISDLPSDIDVLISSIDIQQMDPETLNSFQESLEELETMFKDTAMIDSNP